MDLATVIENSLVDLHGVNVEVMQQQTLQAVEDLEIRFHGVNTHNIRRLLSDQGVTPDDVFPGTDGWEIMKRGLYMVHPNPAWRTFHRLRRAHHLINEVLQEQIAGQQNAELQELRTKVAQAEASYITLAQELTNIETRFGCSVTPHNLITREVWQDNVFLDLTARGFPAQYKEAYMLLGSDVNQHGASGDIYEDDVEPIDIDDIAAETPVATTASMALHSRTVSGTNTEAERTNNSVSKPFAKAVKTNAQAQAGAMPGVSIENKFRVFTITRTNCGLRTGVLTDTEGDTVSYGQMWYFLDKQLRCFIVPGFPVPLGTPPQIKRFYFDDLEKLRCTPTGIISDACGPLVRTKVGTRIAGKSCMLRAGTMEESETFLSAGMRRITYADIVPFDLESAKEIRDRATLLQQNFRQQWNKRRDEWMEEFRAWTLRRQEYEWQLIKTVASREFRFEVVWPLGTTCDMLDSITREVTERKFEKVHPLERFSARGKRVLETLKFTAELTIPGTYEEEFAAAGNSTQ